MWKHVVQWGSILAGAFIYSVGLNAFLVANHLAEGGLVGVSVVLLYKLGWPLWLTFLLFNLPLLIPGWRVFGHGFIVKTGVGVGAVSLFTGITSHMRVPDSDPLLAALYAGVVTGIGLGIIFRMGATTGGVDIVARLIRHYRGIDMGKTLFAIDVVVLGMVAVVIGRQTAMVSLVALFVSSRVIDFVIEGVRSGRAVTIISDHSAAIADAIHTHLERGTTMLEARGGYTGASRQVVYCVVPREEILRLERIVADADPRAFVVINKVHDVLGEGFTYDSPPSPYRT